MSHPDPIERVILEAAHRVLSRRSATLRNKAANMISTIPDRDGRNVPVIDPKAKVSIGTAELFERIADDLSLQTTTYRRQHASS